MALAITGVGGNSGIVQRVGGAIDSEPEADTFFAAMDAASEPYWQSEVGMVNTLVSSLKTANLWDKFTLLWLPVGETLAGSMRALKHPNGAGTVMTNVGFTAANWNRLAGLDGRGVTHRIDTLTTEGNYAPSTNTHIMVIVEEPPPSPGPFREVGRLTGNGFELIISFGGFSYYRSFSGQSGAEISAIAAPTDIRGVWVGSRLEGVARLYHNGGQRGAVAANFAAQAPVTTTNIGLFATGTSVSSKLLSAASIGRGFTPAEHEAVNTIFQTARSARALLTP